MDLDKELGRLYQNVGSDFELTNEAEKIASAPNYFISNDDLQDMVDHKVLIYAPVCTPTFLKLQEKSYRCPAISETFKKVMKISIKWALSTSSVQAPARCLGERVVVEVYRRIARHILEETGALPRFGGAEWWCQVYKKTTHGLSFHFDADTAKQAEGQMVNPILSSVLYLTGTAGREPGAAESSGSAALKRALKFGWREGATAITDQVYDHTHKRPMPDPPTQLLLVFPEAGNFCIFDGRLGHGVLDTSLIAGRQTFLINFWETRPQAIERVTPAHVEEFGFSPDPGPLPLPAADAIARCAVPALYLDPPSTRGAEEGGGPVSLRGVLERQGCQLTGPGAVSIVSIRHPGHLLYPVDREQAVEYGGGIGAVFVTEDMVGSSSSESDLSAIEEGEETQES